MERVLLGVLLGLLVYLLYLVFSPFLVPLAWAVVLAIMFFPVHRRIHGRLKWPNRSALLTTLLLAVVIIAPGLLILSVFTGQAIEAVEWIRDEWQAGGMPFGDALKTVPVERVVEWLEERDIQTEEMRAFITNKLESLAGFLAGQAGRLARNLLVFLFHLFVTLFATFYLFRDGPYLFERIRRGLPLQPEQREQLIDTAHDVLYASVFSSFVVAAVQGVLGGFAFWLLGLGAPVVWGFVMAFLSLLPVLGAWLVWVPACIFLALQAEWIKALILLLVGMLVIGLADNVLRPILVSGRSQLNGLLVFISILGGIAAFGLLGLVLGPIVVALGSAVIEAYTTEPPAAPAAGR